jgi:hypothetical protein
VSQDGEALGPVELGCSDWVAGGAIYRGGEPDLRIVDVLASEDPETFTILIVEDA